MILIHSSPTNHVENIDKVRMVIVRLTPTRAVAAVAMLALAGPLAACAGTASSSSGGGTVTLSLVAYSTPQAAYQKLIAAFQKTSAGKSVTCNQSHCAS